MAEHRARTRRSVHVRAILSLGLLAGLAVTGTSAFWTDDVTIDGTTFTAGTLDLQVNAADAVTTSTLSMSSTPMVPGNTSAEVLSVRNNGTVPLKYTLTGGLAGSGAASISASTALRLTIRAGATRSGSGSAATCTGGTLVVGPLSLTDVVTTSIIGVRRGPLAPAAAESLCFQVSFDATAPSSLQGRPATVTFTATGTSDVS